MIVKLIHAEEDWLINRWFYFSEQAETYMWNFAEKICTDVEYRRRSLEETADWKRVANLYEPLARRLYHELSRSERSDFPIMDDCSRDDSKKSIVRQETDKHPETIYDEKEAELQQWLADASK
jgi:hypothetical protein